MANPTELTVIVKDGNAKPAEGAEVSITPAESSGKTDAKGEIVFKLTDAKKYDVNVTLGTQTVKVPYYVIDGGSSRLEVNVAYVASVDATSTTTTLPTTSTVAATTTTIASTESSSWVKDNPGVAVASGTALLLVVGVVVSLLFGKRRHKQEQQASDSSIAKDGFEKSLEEHYAQEDTKK